MGQFLGETRIRAMTHCAAIVCALTAAWGGSVARAEEPDAVYGRLGGDVAASLAGTFAARLNEVGGAESLERWGGAVELRARYLDSAGLYLAPELRADGRIGVGAGVDLRPLFLARFLENLSIERPFWDLLVDSIGLEIGAFARSTGERVGVALELGTGVDVPLGSASANMPFLRVGLRARLGRTTDQLGPARDDGELWLMLGIGYRTMIRTGLVSVAR